MRCRTIFGAGCPGVKRGSRWHRRPQPLIALALIAITVTGCSVDAVAGQRQLDFYGEEYESSMGAGADPAIKSQYGELDDPIVNAVALPGGYGIRPVGSAF